MNQKNNTILITGSTGFVGSNLLPFLQNSGCTALGISRNPSENEISYEALTPKVWDNATAMVHLAGKAHDLKKTSNDSEYFEVNYELTKILYDQFLASNTQQFIYISSVKAVADSVEDILTEEVIPNPITAYGKSKHKAEAYILDNLPATKKVYILRPCMIHGPGNKGNLNLLYSLVSKGFPWPLGAFENQRSFLSVENLCFVIKELLTQQNIPSGIYLPLNSERLQKLTESYVVSNQKILSAIGKRLPIASKEGLLKTFSSFSPLTPASPASRPEGRTER